MILLSMITLFIFSAASIGSSDAEGSIVKKELVAEKSVLVAEKSVQYNFKYATMMYEVCESNGNGTQTCCNFEPWSPFVQCKTVPETPQQE